MVVSVDEDSAAHGFFWVKISDIKHLSMDTKDLLDEKGRLEIKGEWVDTNTQQKEILLRMYLKPSLIPTILSDGSTIPICEDMKNGTLPLDFYSDAYPIDIYRGLALKEGFITLEVLSLADLPLDDLLREESDVGIVFSTAAGPTFSMCHLNSSILPVENFEISQSFVTAGKPSDQEGLYKEKLALKVLPLWAIWLPTLKEIAASRAAHSSVISLIARQTIILPESVFQFQSIH